MSPFRTAAVAAIGLLLPGVAAAQQGVTPDQVTFGQVAVFEGPAAALGTGMHTGLTAAFEEANAAGGVHGRKLVLDTHDDGYEPDRAADMVRQLIAADSVFALIGPVGTPTSSATQPLAAEAGVPFVGPFTGAGFLRDPSLGNVVNVRASYDAETEAWMAHLVDRGGLKDIAILYQDDSYGRAGLSGVVAALERRGLALVAEGTYTRNTTAVRSALLDIRRAQPQAVVMVGAYQPVAEFIRLSRQLKFDPVFVNLSFVGSAALAEELGPDGAGVIVSQVVPFPWDASLPAVAEYQAALAAHVPGSAPDFISLEGYLVGRIAIEALKAAGPEPTREGFLAAVQAMRAFDLGGLEVSFGPDDNQALDAVFMTEITPAGSFVQIEIPGS